MNERDLLQIGPGDSEGPAVFRVDLGGDAKPAVKDLRYSELELRSDAKEGMNKPALPGHVARRGSSLLPRAYLKHSMVIISEMGLRPYKELIPMLKPQVDLENGVVHIPDSKTPHGIGDMPMTALARTAFAAQIAETPGSEYLFPTPNPKAQKQYITNLRKVWVTTLRRAGVPYFSLYELRRTVKPN